MKNLLLMAGLLLLGSCIAPVTPVFETTLSLHVTSSARTLEASLPNVDHYSATLTAADGTSILVAKVDPANPTPLTTGAWTIVVQAFDASEAQIGEGTASLDVVSGSNSVSVVVNPTRLATGSFQITLDYSEGADHLVFLLYPWSSAATVSLPSDAINVSLTSATDPVSLTPDSALVQDATYTLDLTTHHAVFSGQLKSQDYLLQITTMMSAQTSGTYAQILRMYDQGKVEQTLTRPGYTVTYDANGGTGTMAAQPFAFGLTASLDTNAFGAPSGHAFAGWNTKADGSGDSYGDGTGFFQGIDQNLTLYAQWVAVYRVLFNAHGGTGSLSPLSVAAGASATLPGYLTGLAPPPSAPQSLFASWNTQANGSGATSLDGATFDMPAGATADVTLYAQWTYRYQLLFDNNGGSGTLTGTVLSLGQSTTLPYFSNGTMIGPAGATVFNGWNSASSGSGTPYGDHASFTMPANATADVTLFAQWVAAPTYYIFYDANGGTGTVPVDSGHPANTTVGAIAGSLSSGSDVFAYWNSLADGSGSIYRVGDAIFVGSSNVRLYAIYQPADDHGNTMATATMISVGVGSSALSHLTKGDVDYFRVDLPAPGYAIHAWSTGSTDTWGYIDDSVGANLVNNDDSSGLQFDVSASGLVASTYYIRVQPFGASVFGDYTLNWSITLP